MILHVMSVHDKAVRAFMQPFYARSIGEAIRSFTELANDPQTNVARHPSDFVLFDLGEFDDNSGLFISREPRRVLGAYEVVKDVAPPVVKNGSLPGVSAQEFDRP